MLRSGKDDPSDDESTTLISAPQHTPCLFSPKSIGSIVLDHATKGKQTEAESILLQYPHCALEKNHVVDYSNRHFHNISALQYASWALDTHMLRMILRCLPNSLKQTALDQLREVEIAGTTYGKHYDFAIIDELEVYLEELRLHGPETNSERWRTRVGKAQCDVPVHIANEHCHPHRSFNPYPNFKDETLPRSLTIYNYRTEGWENWFPLSEKIALGRDFAITRSLSAHWDTKGCIGIHSTGICPAETALFRDKEALKILRDARTAELHQIIQQLELDLQPSPCCTLL